MLLSHAKVDFTDRVIEMSEWRDIKKNEMGGGQVPAFDITNADGTTSRMTQSTSILRYLGKVHGYYPEDAKVAYEVDRVMDDFNDILGLIYKPHFDKNLDSTDIFEKILPKYLKTIEDRCATNEFMVGDKMTIADFWVGQLYTNYLTNELCFTPEKWTGVLD